MHPKPEIIKASYRGAGKLEGKAALITGGDSGIGRAVAVHFAREGADVACIYLDEDDDARETRRLVEAEGQRCLLLAGDIKDETFCREAVARTVEELSRLDILVNNAAVQFPRERFEEVTSAQVRETFDTNILPHFYFAHAALPHLPVGGAIINTTSVNSYQGSAHLIDYSSTKGAITSFTRSLAQELAPKEIRVNAVAPGPIWTPLIPATFGEKKVDGFGGKSLLERPGQPSEIAPAFVFLAAEDSSYVIGEIININGGRFIGA